MRRAARIGHGLEGAEAIAAALGAGGGAKALEVGIGGPARVARVVVDAERVALPDLDPRARHRPARRIEQPACEMQHSAGGALGAARDLDQVVVAVERQGQRIERPGGLARRRQQGRGAMGTPGRSRRAQRRWPAAGGGSVA